MEPLVSYIIPVFQNLDYCLKLINDIIEKDQNSFEILLVDDGSQPEIKCKIKKVKTIRNPVNGGPSIARNLGASHAKGKYLFFLDSDIFIAANKREEIINEIQEYKSTVIMGVYDPISPLANICSIYKNLYWSYNQINVLNNKNNFCTAIFIIEKQIFNYLDGFNEDLRIGEDREFGERILENSYDFLSKSKYFGYHYKYFNFVTLVSHHFKNSESVAIFLLNKIFNTQKINQKNKILTNYMQMLTIPCGFLLFLTSMLVIFRALSIKVGVVLLLICSIFFLCLIKDFLNFAKKSYGYKIYFMIILLYLVEQIVASFGMLYAIFKFIFLKTTNASIFKILNKRL